MGVSLAYRLGMLSADQNEGDSTTTDQARFRLQVILETVFCPFFQTIGTAQIVTTSLFLYKTRNHKEIKLLPKIMMIMAASESVYI